MSVKNEESRVDFSPLKKIPPRASYSSLMLHRKCPQAWFYRYEMRLEENKNYTSAYLTFGRWWSALRAIESLERGRIAKSLIFVPVHLKDKSEGFAFSPRTSTVTDVLLAAQKRWDLMGIEGRENFVEILGEPLPDRLKNAFDLWDEANPNRFEDELPLGVEIFWKRYIPIPEHLKNPEMPEMQLIGYIDELYWDTRRNMVVVRDHKTSKDIQRANSALDDLMDSQLALYTWGIEPLLEKKNLPKPRALAFDRVRSVAPLDPKLTATGTLSKAVTNYPLEQYLGWASIDTTPSKAERLEIISSKNLQGEQAEEVLSLEPGQFWGKLGEFFVSGPKKGLPKFGVHRISETEIKRLSQPDERAKWVGSTLVPINKKTEDSHLLSAASTAVDIWVTKSRAEISGEATRNLTRFECKMCPFADFCRAQIYGGSRGEYDVQAYGLREKQ